MGIADPLYRLWTWALVFSLMNGSDRHLISESMGRSTNNYAPSAIPAIFI
jgi:hypothetical protein